MYQPFLTVPTTGCQLDKHIIETAERDWVRVNDRSDLQPVIGNQVKGPLNIGHLVTEGRSKIGFTLKEIRRRHDTFGLSDTNRDHRSTTPD